MDLAVYGKHLINFAYKTKQLRLTRLINITYLLTYLLISGILNMMDN